MGLPPLGLMDTPVWEVFTVMGWGQSAARIAASRNINARVFLSFLSRQVMNQKMTAKNQLSDRHLREFDAC